MNKIEIQIKISQYCDEGIKEYESTIRSDYLPRDPNSIIACLSDLNGKTTRFEEDLTHLNKLYENGSIKGFNSTATVSAVRIRFARPDDSIISEIEVDDLNEINLICDLINQFYLD